jgi:hypothetical protein
LNQDSKTTLTPSQDPLSEQWIDLRLIAGMRVVLGTCALFVLLIGPMRTLPGYMPIYFILVFYSLYGLVIYHLSVRRNLLVAHKAVPWLDLLWYVALIAFTSNINNLFYYFFFYSIIVASFSCVRGNFHNREYPHRAS